MNKDVGLVKLHDSHFNIKYNNGLLCELCLHVDNDRDFRNESDCMPTIMQIGYNYV